MPEIEHRKEDHIRISQEEDVGFGHLTTGLERYRFVHQALPELNLQQVDVSSSFLGKAMRAPLLISSMTGGTRRATQINLRLAEAAQASGIAMGLGSQRAAISKPALSGSFQVRSLAPDILLLANLGAVQLNHGFTIDDCRRAVDMVEANALILHFNPLQEALQLEGDTDFAGLLAKVEVVCRQLEVPVVAKEVGWGFSRDAARQLAGAGVAAIDVAGAGGTSWSQVEMHRAGTDIDRQVAASFRDWGIPTVDSIRMAREGAPDLPVIASGGLRNGLDLAKSIALGAHLGGMAGPLLGAAIESTQAVLDQVQKAIKELQIAMFCIGVADLDQLRDTPRLLKEDAEA